MLGPAPGGSSVTRIYDRVRVGIKRRWPNGVTPIDHDDVGEAAGEIRAIWRINELLNWRWRPPVRTVTWPMPRYEVFGTERVQRARPARRNLSLSLVGRVLAAAGPTHRRAAALAGRQTTAQPGDLLAGCV